MKDAIKNNEELQKEALDVIKENHIEEILSKYGEINYGGSYRYGTMVERDIDFALMVKDQNQISVEVKSRIAAELAALENCTDFSISDRKAYPKPHRAKGILFQPILLHNGKLWNFDIWLVTYGEPMIHVNQDLHTKMLEITEEQREKILEIKYQASINNEIKELDSAEVYKAVIGGKVDNYADWLKYKVQQ